MPSSINFKGMIGLSQMALEGLMVPKAGLEPARISTVDFESTASTDFATPARKGMRKTLRIIPLPATFATSIVRSVR